MIRAEKVSIEGWGGSRPAPVGRTVANVSADATRVGGAKLEGAGPLDLVGMLGCVASYNVNYDPLGTNCA